MFFKKSKKEDQDDAVVKRGIKKMDAVITGAILGGVVAWVYGMKKLKDINEKEEETLSPEENSLGISEKTEKKGIFKKIFK